MYNYILYKFQNNTGQTGEKVLLLDLNVEPAWIQGYTGRGVVVAVVDDGKFKCMCRNSY